MQTGFDDSLPFHLLGQGMRSQFGTLVPPGGRVAAYVRSTGIQDGDDQRLSGMLVTTLNAGLARCRSGMNDIVFVLPGHTENVSSADQMSSLVAGTQIVGIGTGTSRPTFTWSAAAATFLLDVANVGIYNCILAMAGPSGTTALTVAAPMTISAAGCGLYGCDLECEIDADQGATIAVTTTTAANDLSIIGCKFYGSSNGTLPTTYLRLVGTDRLRMYDCDFFGATSSATVGVVQMITTASTNVDIRRCNFSNLATAAVHATTGLAASTGHVRDCTFEPPLSLPSPEALGLPPGAKAVFVDSNAATSVVNFAGISNDFSTTLNAGLAKCRASKGDAVVVMPGHAENVASADQMSGLVAGTRVIGMGHGTIRPTFTWTTTGSTWLLDVANATIENCILILATTANSGVSVAAPITVSGAGCAIKNCQIRVDGDADDLATIPITTTAAADDFVFQGNDCIGATAAECTTFLRLVGADRALILDNRIEAASSNVLVGVVQFITTDSLNVRMERNHFRNNKAASSAAVSVSAGATSSSGYVNDLYLTVLDDAAGNLVLGDAVGAFGLSVAAFTFGRHVYVANLAGERMGEVTLVSA